LSGGGGICNDTSGTLTLALSLDTGNTTDIGADLDNNAGTVSLFMSQVGKEFGV
jgi:hypothetical protein